MPADLTKRVSDLEQALKRLTSLTYRAEIAGGVSSYTVATLPVTPTASQIAYASNGRKTGEGVGAGTGVLCYYDGTAWRRVDDGTTVLA